MITYQVFIQDDRYSVATLRLLLAADDAVARETAEQFLRESPHHLAIELYDGARRLAGLGRRPDQRTRRDDHAYDR